MYSPAAADFQLFQGKGGFTLRRPANAGWVTAFVSAPGRLLLSWHDVGTALLVSLLISAKPIS